MITTTALELTASTVLMCAALLVIGYAALTALALRNQVTQDPISQDLQELQRWRMLSQRYMDSLTEFPDVYIALANLNQEARNGTARPACSPDDNGPWTAAALRDVLRRNQREARHVA